MKGWGMKKLEFEMGSLGECGMKGDGKMKEKCWEVGQGFGSWRPNSMKEGGR